jgi:hypothetical protein
VEFHDHDTYSTWTTKNNPSVNTPIAWCGRHDLNRQVSDFVCVPSYDAASQILNLKSLIALEVAAD